MKGKIQNTNIVELFLNILELPLDKTLITKSINSLYEVRARQFIYEQNYSEAQKSIRVISDKYLFLLLYLRLKADMLIRKTRKYFPKR